MDVVFIFVLVAVALVMAFAAGSRWKSWKIDTASRGNRYRWDMAKHAYGSEQSAARQLVECDQNHMPGDCVLCGGDAAGGNQ